ncbi:MAG: radical SAM family heme chaperone HemW [Acidobacteriota bacterium]|nr:radical SAM family heme chaperone HemW [Acidobacteriota bacterium]
MTAPRKIATSLARHCANSRVGLYIHVPFCETICSYCNFTRGLFDAARARRYVAAVVEEIRRASAPLSVDTIYFGGGTPSLLEPEEVTRIIDVCRSSFSVSGKAEITMESNPESATKERLAGYRAAGVTRLSLGVQSFRDTELVMLGRLHSSVAARRAFTFARAVGFKDVSLDLMMWLPGQKVLEWLESVEELIAIGPDHASLYLLEVYPNSPLRDEMIRAASTQAPDEVAAEMYLSALVRLDQAGFQQYEISNVARPGHRSRHNLKYWMDGQWIGFGPGAHSTVGEERWSNTSETSVYLDRLEAGSDPSCGHQKRSTEQQLSEALFMGLRLTEGVDVAAVGDRYGVDVPTRFGAELQPFIDDGQLVEEGDQLRLSREGMLLANEVMAVFV